MSLLMFTIDEDNGFWVLTDTLATGKDFRPGLYQSKALVLPHMNLVVAGTGIAQLNARWWSRLMDQMLCLDIDMLDQHTPESLRELWAEVLDEAPDYTGTATIYHLGLSEATGKFVSYAYRSTDDFNSEPLVPGFRMKPDPPEDWEDPHSVDDLIALADATRRKEDQRPADERIHIGGELQFISMNGNGFTIQRIHRWDDHGDMWLEMNELLREQRGSKLQP